MIDDKLAFSRLYLFMTIQWIGYERIDLQTDLAQCFRAFTDDAIRGAGIDISGRVHSQVFQSSIGFPTSATKSK
jgi:hypothetical protein